MTLTTKRLISTLLMGLTFSIPSFGQTKEAGELKGLPVGSHVTDFNAINQLSKTFVLSDELKKGPIVLIFYRGHWCSYCNKHLSNLQDSLQIIKDLGAQIVAISPQKLDYLGKMVDKTGADYTLLYDEGYRIEEQFDVLFTPDAKTKKKYNVFLKAQLEESHSDDTGRLPIPATFILDKNGVVIWRHFDPDYSKRSTVKEITDQLEVLESKSKEQLNGTD
jgi:peroxiredoxin